MATVMQELDRSYRSELRESRLGERPVLRALSRAERPGAEILGQSAALQTVLTQLDLVAPTDATVLLQGETGTGKELLARALHTLSARHARPFLTLNCAAIPSGLLESELFGYEKGAFTGALTQRLGRLELADGGTLFLDEIGDLPLELQPKLLRVLQEHAFERLGSSRTVHVNVRVVAATHRDLLALVHQQQFRADLYYRLHVFPLTVPPLRERREDIPLLVDHFVRKFSLAMNKRITRVSPGAMNQLQQQPWLGNIRELENAVERAMVVAQEPELREQDFIFKAQVANNGADKTLDEIERAHILRVLEECGGNQSHAAEILDIDRVTLHHKLKKYGWTRTPVESR